MRSTNEAVSVAAAAVLRNWRREEDGEFFMRHQSISHPSTQGKRNAIHSNAG